MTEQQIIATTEFDRLIEPVLKRLDKIEQDLKDCKNTRLCNNVTVDSFQSYPLTSEDFRHSD